MSNFTFMHFNFLYKFILHLIQTVFECMYSRSNFTRNLLSIHLHMRFTRHYDNSTAF